MVWNDFKVSNKTDCWWWCTVIEVASYYQSIAALLCYYDFILSGWINNNHFLQAKASLVLFHLSVFLTRVQQQTKQKRRRSDRFPFAQPAWRRGYQTTETWVLSSTAYLLHQTSSWLVVSTSFGATVRCIMGGRGVVWCGMARFRISNSHSTVGSNHLFLNST